MNSINIYFLLLKKKNQVPNGTLGISQINQKYFLYILYSQVQTKYYDNFVINFRQI